MEEDLGLIEQDGIYLIKTAQDLVNLADKVTKVSISQRSDVDMIEAVVGIQISKMKAIKHLNFLCERSGCV